MAHRIILAIVTVAALLHTLPATASETHDHSHEVRTATAESCTVADGPKGTTVIHCKSITVRQ